MSTTLGTARAGLAPAGFQYRGPEPKGDQPKAIRQLVEGFASGLRYQTLLGATGTGKTVTMAKVIETLSRPTLVMAPNKVLAAQLAAEFRELFPENAVEYFISYYDYYQPEAYVPGRDLFIEKDASINPEIERLGNAKEARSTLRFLLRSYPGYTPAREALNRLGP